MGENKPEQILSVDMNCPQKIKLVLQKTKIKMHRKKDCLALMGFRINVENLIQKSKLLLKDSEMICRDKYDRS